MISELRIVLLFVFGSLMLLVMPGAHGSPDDPFFPFWISERTPDPQLLGLWRVQLDAEIKTKANSEFASAKEIYHWVEHQERARFKFAGPQSHALQLQGGKSESGATSVSETEHWYFLRLGFHSEQLSASADQAELYWLLFDGASIWEIETYVYPEWSSEVSHKRPTNPDSLVWSEFRHLPLLLPYRLNHQVDVLVNVRGNGPVFPTVRLYTTSTLEGVARERVYFGGLYAGLLLGLMIWHLFLWCLHRQPVQFHALLLWAVFGGVQLFASALPIHGLAVVDALADRQRLLHYEQVLMPLAFAVAVLYSKSLFNPLVQSRWAGYGLSLLILAALVVAGLSWWVPGLATIDGYINGYMLLEPVYVLVLLLLGTIMIRYWLMPGVLFVGAWLIYLIGMWIDVLSRQGVLKDSLAVENIQPWTVLLALMLLSLALLSRMRNSAHQAVRGEPSIQSETVPIHKHDMAQLESWIEDHDGDENAAPEDNVALEDKDGQHPLRLLVIVSLEQSHAKNLSIEPPHRGVAAVKTDRWQSSVIWGGALLFQTLTSIARNGFDSIDRVIFSGYSFAALIKDLQKCEGIANFTKVPMLMEVEALDAAYIHQCRQLGISLVKPGGDIEVMHTQMLQAKAEFDVHHPLLAHPAATLRGGSEVDVEVDNELDSVAEQGREPEVLITSESAGRFVPEPSENTGGEQRISYEKVLEEEHEDLLSMSFSLPASKPESQTVPLVDWRQALEHSDGSEDTLKERLAILLNEQKDQLHILLDAFDQRDYRLAERAVRLLAKLAADVPARQLHHCAAGLTEALCLRLSGNPETGPDEDLSQDSEIEHLLFETDNAFRQLVSYVDQQQGISSLLRTWNTARNKGEAE
ncbi:hypothetical protein OLMES_4088 [Oleiphilus messinensis]|uniref:7TM-DISM receptor extracellular domain-containing protein n=1 Tax=Oleiphilus messinensis TaxID=141451 RepID=A0A1Y0IF55_9GAMM|nr:7TM diverse intracellular signaling domain-containing protein [Oleiphilus messinensis]ARU58105.1 hypothetical protein OLMES_4088 [Oleiphilus messinensis]